MVFGILGKFLGIYLRRRKQEIFLGKAKVECCWLGVGGGDIWGGGGWHGYGWEMVGGGGVGLLYWEE